jgi:endo-1,4-beta-D-glucanase Y
MVSPLLNINNSIDTMQLAQMAPPRAGDTASINSTPAVIRQKAWGNWKSQFVVDLPAGSIVHDTANNRCPSEGLGYGLYMAVEQNDRATFDKLLKGMDSYFLKPDGLFYSFVTKAGTRFPSSDAARYPQASSADADIYIAAALIMAAKKWSAPAYQARAQKVMNAVYDNEIAKLGNRLVVKPSDGNWTGDVVGKTVFNPSYFTPAWLKLFAATDNDPGHKWVQAVSDGYELLGAILQKSGDLDAVGQNPIPDWVLISVGPGNDFELRSAKAVLPDHEYNAIRVPLEIGRDAIVNNDQRAIDFIKSFLVKADVHGDDSVKIGGNNNEIAWACYGTALKAVDPNRRFPSFASAIKSSFNPSGGYFGSGQRDASDYYKQSLVLMSVFLIF